MSITVDNRGLNSNINQVSVQPNDTDSGKLLSMSTFTTAGTYTWTKPNGCNSILVKVVGGGGGGSGYCESGGGGGFSEKWIDVSGVTSVSVTVGAGGAIAAYSGGNNGGTSSFGSYCSASGGYGSNTQFGHTGGSGGIGYSGDINLFGGSGTGHANSTGEGQLGRGGATYWGGSKSIDRQAASLAVGPGAPGSGGAGGRTNANYAGSAGAAGAVMIWEYR